MSWRTGNGVDSERVPLFYWIVLLLLWIWLKIFFRLRVSGRENVPRMGGCVVAANHASYLDPPIVGAALRFRAVRFMARESLFRNRFFGWFLRSHFLLSGFLHRLFREFFSRFFFRRRRHLRQFDFRRRGLRLDRLCGLFRRRFGRRLNRRFFLRPTTYHQPQQQPTYHHSHRPS